MLTLSDNRGSTNAIKVRFLLAELGLDERLLATDGYAAGDFSIADCAIAGRMQYIGQLPIDLGLYRRLRRALDLTFARPAYQAAVGALRRRG